MSLTARILVVAALLAWAGPALAQPAFVPPDQLEEDGDGTDIDGRISSTTVVHRETGGIGPPLLTGGAAPEPVSPFARVFTDLRLQLELDHIAGSSVDWRSDARVRYLVTDGPSTSNKQDDPAATLPYQSGRYGGEELHLRELYLRRRGAKADVYLGRQVVLEIAALEIDGLRVVWDKSPRWDVIAFAGLHPARGSRSIHDDYPEQRPNPLDPTAAAKRVMPVAVGLGGAYRFGSAFGSIGAGAIAPLADDAATGSAEDPRLFVTSQGYWRVGRALDVYHYAVADAYGAGGPAVNNLSVGLDFHPVFNFRVNASVNHVDTETLNVIAQTRLEEPDPNVAAAGALLQNNIEVQRIAQQSARVSVSAAFRQRRFELSTSGMVRRRPELAILAVGGAPVVFPEARAADVTLQVLDRRSPLDARLGASVTRVFGLGDRVFANSQSVTGRVFGSRELGDKTELELELGYYESIDQSQGKQCPTAADPLACFGTAEVTTLSLNATAFHRLGNHLSIVGAANIGRMSLTAQDAAGGPIAQPPALILSGLLRVDLRF
jgi:hypothetical protein